ncbi:DJ-1/PfpI family protein [Paraburkholderia aromaticivorans]|uniref:AraC family transcriptional regulator n=1 Tax=Paraburkholderia aromaticivorans TaxID=2026199 RepID=A0A248VDI5_9BURK|nr:DJ-1/PfpI family protein [Paraburkholderia aromaticivorans]ASV96894.1 AraC family transcriptional regulator [Paraburkholderia aromaticivorans]
MQVAMMLYAGFRLLEVTGPMDVFHEANRLCGATLYEQHLVGPSAGPVLCSNGVAVGATDSLLDAPVWFDIVVVPGCPVLGSSRELHDLVNWLKAAGHRVRRFASVSNGAFLIARAGLADHRPLTTHWRDARRLSSEYPVVRAAGDRGCSKEGGLHASRGITDGIQVALELVREDLGDEFARSITKSLSRRRS